MTWIYIAAAAYLLFVVCVLMAALTPGAERKDGDPANGASDCSVPGSENEDPYNPEIEEPL